MILRALHTNGKLDISSQGVYPGGDSLMDTMQFRLTLDPGQTVEINDEFRSLKNIDCAIRAGLLEVISYGSDPDSGVAQEEVNNIMNNITEQVEQLMSKFNPKVISTDYSANIGDYILCNTETSLVILLPESNSESDGRIIIIKNINNGLVSIDAFGDEKIDNNKTIYLSNIWESVILINSGNDWYIALRDIGEDDWSSESS